MDAQDNGQDFYSSYLEQPLPQMSPDYPEDDWQDEVGSQPGSAHLSSGPDEEVFDNTSHRSSPRTSQSSDAGSADENSWLSQEVKAAPDTPSKARSPFRNPSSVRAMQTDITPPERYSFSAQRRKNHLSPSRKSTPRSTHSLHSPMRYPDKRTNKEFPLVLLHVTLLSLPTHYSPDMLASVLPPTICFNWRLLEEKIAQTVLERGILIPHPQEDYDLLEERLLESLELKAPRILKCGHFHLSPEEEADVNDRDSGDEDEDENADTCEDCGRKIRDGHFGDAGSGSKRWDIKIFAANGLMRAGAWGAAWKEMERVDAQILPWMEEGMRRELERRRQEEEDEKSRIEHEQMSTEDGIGGLDDERVREIYGQNLPELKTEALDEEHTRRQGAQRQFEAQGDEVPLSELLAKYLAAFVEDRRNVAICLLSVLVLFLAMSYRTPAQALSNVPISATPPARSTPNDQIMTSTGSTISKVVPLTDSSVAPQATAEAPETLETKEMEYGEQSWNDVAEGFVEAVVGE